MATRSNIAKKTTTGYEFIYCHFDGYPSHNGKILLEHYQDENKVQELIDLGDISSLGEEIGEEHDFNQCPPKQCNAYGRDRKEEDVDTRFSDSLEGCYQEQYLYVWQDGKWYICDRTKFELNLLTQETIQNN